MASLQDTGLYPRTGSNRARNTEVPVPPAPQGITEPHHKASLETDSCPEGFSSQFSLYTKPTVSSLSKVKGKQANDLSTFFFHGQSV